MARFLHPGCKPGVRMAVVTPSGSSRSDRSPPDSSPTAVGVASPLSLPARMIEPIARGDGNAVQGAVLGRCVRTSCCAGRSAAPRGRLSRRALLSSAGVLQQPALPHHPPAELLAPTAVVLSAPAHQ